MHATEIALQYHTSRSRIERSRALGLSLQVYRWGHGAPRFVLLHGLGEGSFVWQHVVPSLLPAGPIMAIDLRGHGDSAHAAAHGYTSAHHVEDVSTVLGELCPQPVILVGHSLGAEVALRLAALHRSKVIGLTLVDGGPQLNAEAVRHLEREFAGQPWEYATIDEFVCHLERKFPLAAPSLLRQLAPHALREDPSGGYRLKCDRALTQCWQDRDEEALWSLLGSICFPFLVIRGAGSAVLPSSTVARMTRETRWCVAETVPGAGHNVMLDNPEGFIAPLRGYVSRVLDAARNGFKD